jgi:hypothetical protein
MESSYEAFGVRMRDLFETAKPALAMPLGEVYRLFDCDLYEVRMGAGCILDFRPRRPAAGPTNASAS